MIDFDVLWAMEKSFWLDGPEFYEEAMAPDALMVFPDPVGILAGNQIVEGLKEGPRWKFVDFEDKMEIALRDTAVLSYGATGHRDNDDPYRAVCASTYVKSDGNWLLLAHQQTPKT